jgi:hypothetical protein
LCCDVTGPIQAYLFLIRVLVGLRAKPILNEFSALRVPLILRDIGSQPQQPARTSNSGHWRHNIRSPIVDSMRLKSSIWVAAYLRRCQTEGVFGAVRRRGAEEAGAVFVKVALLDGNAMLYVPAPQAVYDDRRPVERIFTPSSPAPVPEQSVEERLAREIRFDPDAWIVESEDRAGRHFLDLART